MQIVSFIVNESLYGLKITQVKEISEAVKIISFDNMPFFLRGLVNLRGHHIPLVDFHKRFQLPSCEGDTQLFLVADYKGNEIGLTIDEVSQVIKVDEDGIMPAPLRLNGVPNDYIIGIAQNGEDFISILDLDKVFNINEFRDLSEFLKKDHDILAQQK